MIKVLISSALVAYASAAVSFSYGSFGGLGGGYEEHRGGLGGLSLGGHGIALSEHRIEHGKLEGGLGLGLGGGEAGYGHHAYKEYDYYTKPHYEYAYAVHDPKHHDLHQQKEQRYGDKVVGEYSLHEPDGTIRVVKYEADKHNGFNAIVERKGHAVHPEHYKTYHHH